MKNVFFIGGTMGVGKTSICRELNKLLPRSVFLDGDWCWNMAPFVVNDETKKMVQGNIAFLLNSFISCSELENIIFCWVMDHPEIIDGLKGMLDLGSCRFISISLVCTDDALRQRLEADIKSGVRKHDIIARSLERQRLYDSLESDKTDVSDITPAQAAELIAQKYTK